jgi:sec-independent protein translocase protein TatB
MFPDLSWSHMLLVLIVALVVVGPKDLPKLMRKMGQWTAKARGMADQFRRSFDEMARQSELDELRKELDELRNSRPLADVDQQMSQMLTGPAVTLEPEPKVEPEQRELDLTPQVEHGEPVPQTVEPAEPIPLGDQHPPPP